MLFSRLMPGREPKDIDRLQQRASLQAMGRKETRQVRVAVSRAVAVGMSPAPPAAQQPPPVPSLYRGGSPCTQARSEISAASCGIATSAIPNVTRCLCRASAPARESRAAFSQPRAHGAMLLAEIPRAQYHSASPYAMIQCPQPITSIYTHDTMLMLPAPTHARCCSDVIIIYLRYDERYLHCLYP